MRHVFSTSVQVELFLFLFSYPRTSHTLISNILIYCAAYSLASVCCSAALSVSSLQLPGLCQPVTACLYRVSQCGLLFYPTSRSSL